MQQVSFEDVLMSEDDVGSFFDVVSEDWHRLFDHIAIVGVFNVVKNCTLLVGDCKVGDMVP